MTCWAARIAALLACCVVSAGCCPHPPPPRAAYTGPTISLDELVSHIDANNEQIPSLWTRHDFNGTIFDDQHQSHSFSARGVLLYRAPHELLIKANDDFGNPLFEIGVTPEFYWLKVVPQDTLWWGRTRNAGRPGAVPIPIRPDLILDVLAVGTMDTNLSHEPFPVMRFDPAADTYVIDTIANGRDRLLIQKEVRYDRQTLAPRQVTLFDPTGRESLQADLSDPQPLSAPNSPILATHYHLFFPDSGTMMDFTLSDTSLTRKGIPSAASIHLPDLNNPGVKKVIAIDKED